MRKTSDGQGTKVSKARDQVLEEQEGKPTSAHAKARPQQLVEAIQPLIETQEESARGFGLPTSPREGHTHTSPRKVEMSHKKKHQKATSKKRRDKKGSVLNLNTGKSEPTSTVYTYVGNNEDPPVVTVYADTFPYQGRLCRP
jgi:hypothetical protein